MRSAVKRTAPLALSLLAGCAASTDPFDEDPYLQRDLDQGGPFPSDAGFSYWTDRPGNGPLNVTIDLSDQAAYIQRGSVLVARSRVATGRPGHSTPTGSYTILRKTADKRSNLYGHIHDASGAVVNSDADSRTDPVPPGGRFVGASMPYWMRLTNSGIGMHAGPIPNPGSPASHGCIRMPPEMARRLFLAAPIGTPVRIQP